jgi:hypothetical protein
MSDPAEMQGRALPAVVVGASRAQEERALTLGGRHGFRLPAQARLAVVDHYRPSADPLVARLIDEGQLTPGAVLVLSPFNTGNYAPEADAEMVFEREKIQLISRLCQVLGAVQVTSDTTTLTIDQTVTKGALTIGKKVGRLTPYKGKGELTLDEREEWRQNLKVHDLYPGGPPDLTEARRMVAAHRLVDPEIYSLVEARDQANQLQSRRITVVYEGKQDRNLDIAADVGLPAVSGAAKFRRSRTTRKRVSLDLDIRFP